MTTSSEAFEVWKRRAADSDILDVSTRIGAKLRKHSHEWVGPCPRCGGKDRFSVRPSKQVFNCRGAGGGDVIAMVMHACAVEFLAACEIITGEPPPGADTVITEETRRKAEELKAQAAEKQRRREHDDNLYRARERKTVFDIWDNAHPLQGSSAAEYLALRGLTFPSTPAGRSERLKCVEAMPYHLDRDTIVHRGPALVAPIVDSDRKFRGLHFTYLDLGQPKGKIVIQDPQEDPGELLDAKKSRGSVKGNYVAVLGPAEDPAQLVLAEGIEKLIAVQMGLVSVGRDLSSTAFWSACNMGNLGGGAASTVPHPTRRGQGGRPERVPGAVPELEAPAIAIPDSVRDLVLLGDTTSDPFTTRLALARASARYARPGRTVRVAWAPDGADFDDLLRYAKGDEQATSDALAKIAGLVDAAGPIELPEIPRGDDEPIKKSARRKPRSDHPSSAANGVDKPPLPAAVVPVAASAVADAFDASSQKGGSAEKKPAVGNGGGPEPPVGVAIDPAELNRRLAFHPLTDLGNAERFRDRNRGRFIWCPALGWLWWDGRRWSRDGADDKVKAAEHDTVRAIQDEAAELRGATLDEIARDPDRRGKHDVLLGSKKVYGDDRDWYLSDALAGWGRQSEQANKLAPIAKRAAPYLAVATEQLDADPFKFNLANGTLVFSKVAEGDYVTFKPHDPADLITKCSRVGYEAGATCPRFDAFMADVQPDADDRRCLMQWQGSNLTGDVGDQKLCIFWGKGKNGKSTFIDVCAHIAGDYSETVPIETFLNEGRSRNAGQATPDLAILPGVRHLRTSEPNKGAKLDEALIKLATGGEQITARHLNRDYFKFYPQFKLTISGNYRPQIGGADEGIWRRVLLVPWTVTVPEDKRDRHLGDKLRVEAPGILNRLLDGLRDWMDHGLSEPKHIAEATADYRRDSDPLGRFIGDCVAPEAGGRVQSSVMHALFCAWAKANGAREWSNKGMTDALKERGFNSTKSGVMFWVDVKLVRDVGDFVDHEGRPRQTESRQSQGDGLDAQVPF